MRNLLLLLVPVLMLGCNPNRCQEASFGGPFCVPDSGVAPAGQKVTLEIMQSCGSGCTNTGSTFECVVARDGGSIALSIGGTSCDGAPGTACPAICTVSRFSCELPALEEGDYTVTAPGQAAQLLRIRDGGVGGACSASTGF